jgi:hypothetical protein
MNTQKTIDLLVEMKLTGMAAAYQAMTEEPEHKLPPLNWRRQSSWQGSKRNLKPS